MLGYGRRPLDFKNNLDGSYRILGEERFKLYTLNGRIEREALEAYTSSHLSRYATIETLGQGIEYVDELVVNGVAIGADLAIGITLDVGFQVAGDWNDPFLNRNQRIGRGFFSGVGAVASGGAGIIAQGVAVYYLGIASGPAGWIGLGVGLGTDYVIGEYLIPIIYQQTGLESTRDLEILR